MSLFPSLCRRLLHENSSNLANMREMNASRASLSFLDTSRDDRLNSETSSNSGLGFGNKLQMYKSYDSLDVRALENVFKAHKLHAPNYFFRVFTEFSELTCNFCTYTFLFCPEFQYPTWFILSSKTVSSFLSYWTGDNVLLFGVNISVDSVKRTANCCTMVLKWTFVNITQKYWPTLLFTEFLCIY